MHLITDLALSRYSKSLSVVCQEIEVRIQHRGELFVFECSLQLVYYNNTSQALPMYEAGTCFLPVCLVKDDNLVPSRRQSPHLGLSKHLDLVPHDVQTPAPNTDLPQLQLLQSLLPLPLLHRCTQYSQCKAPGQVAHGQYPREAEPTPDNDTTQCR